MALELKIGRTGMKIVHTEDNRTTVWEVPSVTTEQNILRTLRSVLAFVEGATPQLNVAPKDRPALPVRTPKASLPPTLGETQAANGWEVYDMEKLEEAP